MPIANPPSQREQLQGEFDKLDYSVQVECSGKFQTYLAKGEFDKAGKLIQELKEHEHVTQDSLDPGGRAAVPNLILVDPRYKKRHVQKPYKDGRPRSVSFLSRLAVYCSICAHAFGKKKTSFPGIGTICQETGLDRTVVIRALRDLEILELIETSPRYNATGRTSSQYRIPGK